MFVLYQKPFGKKNIIKFFDTKEKAIDYIQGEFWGTEPWDKYNTDYRNKYIKENFIIEEASMAEILNLFFEEINNLNNNM